MKLSLYVFMILMSGSFSLAQSKSPNLVQLDEALVVENEQLKPRYKLRFYEVNKLFDEFYSPTYATKIMTTSCENQHKHYRFLMTNYSDLNPELQDRTRDLLAAIRKSCGRDQLNSDTSQPLSYESKNSKQRKAVK